MATVAREAGRRVLLVEDEYFIADDMARAFEAEGVDVVGPVGSLEEAMLLIACDNPLDGAVLDINLHGDMVFPVADALAERGIRFVFATGYDRSMIPERHAHVPRCEKPIAPAKVARSLFS
jgi:ActR/RegA family two-component response regulator